MCGKVAGRWRTILGSSPKEMDVPIKVDEELYFEGKFDTEAMLNMLEKKVLEPAGVDYSSIKIRYMAKGQEQAKNIAQDVLEHEEQEQHATAVSYTHLIVITDMCDRLILDTCGYVINSWPNQEFCKEINPFLIPSQMGEKDAGEVLSVSRDVAEQYCREEDEAATMAEIGMM